MGIRSKLINFFAKPSIAPYTPKSISCFLDGYSLQTFFHDCIAGISVGVIALPLAMAFAIAAGLDPAYGIYTACIAGFLNSLFGGSLFLIGGPTGAYVLLIYGIHQKFGYIGLQAATIEAAIILLLLGALKMGNIIRFIPYPVILGFTNGIALAIGISQIKDFFGLQIPIHSIDPFERLQGIVSYAHTISWTAFFLSATTLYSIFYIRKRSKRLPAIIIALTMTTLINWLFHLSGTTVQDRFDAIPSSLPLPEIPLFSFDLLRAVFPDAIGIALLGAIESLLCAVIADSITGTTHKSNCELIAQGIANIGSTLFHGIPSTGAIARTTASIHLGAKTPVAGMIHAITLLGLVLFLAPAASLVPLASLAAVLIFIAWNMFEWHHMTALIRGERSEALGMLATLLTTIFVDLNTAVEVGILISIILFVKKSREMTQEKLWEQLEAFDTHAEQEGIIHPPSSATSLPKETAIYELEGPFFFAVADLLNDAFLRFETIPKTLIVRMRSVPFIDSSGIHALRRFYDLCQLKGVTLYFSEVRPEVLASLQKASFFKTFPENHMIEDISAISEAL